MTIAQLYKKLRAGYTSDNLHKITTKIIHLQKNRQYDAIHQIMNVVAGFTKEKEEQNTKAFYMLMMIYHPDRINHHLAEMERHYAAHDMDQLNRYSHIFPVIALEPTLTIMPRTETPPTTNDVWDATADGFEYGTVDDDIPIDEVETELFDAPEPEADFFSVFKRIIYGHENIELPAHYLEDIDVIDMSGYDIRDLDGIRFCKQLVTLDLSNNAIIDCSELAYCDRLKELYLADNRIGLIDDLAYLSKLRIVDLSNNAITDISPLFGLDRLEYVNCVGNRIAETQIAVLVKNGVMVIR